MCACVCVYICIYVCVFVTFLGDSFKGSVSQFNIWSSGEMLSDTPTCRSDTSGDKLSWRTFIYANLTETLFNSPSECDGKTL